MRKRSAEQKRETRNEILKTLKGFIVPAIIFAIIAAFVIFVVKYQQVEEEEQVIPVNAYAGDGKAIVLEDDCAASNNVQPYKIRIVFILHKR